MAQWQSTCFIIWRLWVRIPLGAGLFFFFFLSFPTSLPHWSVLNQVPQGDASLTVCCESNKKWMPSCAAWGKTGSISSDWVKNMSMSTTVNIRLHFSQDMIWFDLAILTWSTNKLIRFRFMVTHAEKLFTLICFLIAACRAPSFPSALFLSSTKGSSIPIDDENFHSF